MKRTGLLLAMLMSLLIGCDGSGDTSSKEPTKAQWREKIRPYWNPGGGIKIATVAVFKGLVGEPADTQTLNGISYWYYHCADGIIQIELIDPSMSGGKMLIRAVNDY